MQILGMFRIVGNLINLLSQDSNNKNQVFSTLYSSFECSIFCFFLYFIVFPCSIFFNLRFSLIHLNNLYSKKPSLQFLILVAFYFSLTFFFFIVEPHVNNFLLMFLSTLIWNLVVKFGMLTCLQFVKHFSCKINLKLFQMFLSILIFQ